MYNLCAYCTFLQVWTSLNVANAQGPSNALAEHLYQDVSKPTQDTNSGVSQPLPTETKSSGRKELPVVIALAYIVLDVSQNLLMIYA